MIDPLIKFLRDEEGLTTVEYAIAGGLVGAAIVLAFIALGGTVGNIITFIDGNVSSNSPAP